MLEYIKKFNQLPVEIRSKISNQVITQKIEELEKKYNCNLAMLVMRVVIKDILFDDLQKYIVTDLKLPDNQATLLLDDLKKVIFSDILPYLTGKEIKDSEKIAPQVLTPNKPRLGSNFYFSPEDEEEIRTILKKIDGYNPSQTAALGMDEMILEIMKELNIDFGSQELSGRFEQIIHTYIKGVRNKIDTRISLGKSVMDGGLKFDEQTIDKIFKLIDQKKSNSKAQKMPAPPKIKLPEERNDIKKKIDFANLQNGNRDVDYDFSKFKEKEANKNNTTDLKHRLAPPPPAIIKKADPKLAPPPPAIIKKLDSNPAPRSGAPVVEEEKKQKGISETTKNSDSKLAPPPPAIIKADSKLTPKSIAPIVEKEKKQVGVTETIKKTELKSSLNPEKSSPSRFNASNNIQSINRYVPEFGRTRMQDVKAVPKIMSPIDELRYMDFVNFRRMGDGATAITEKIKQKISFLEEEKYSRRIEGIKAWRNSPVNRLYLQIGQESIGQKKPISVIIEERKKKGQDYLSQAEMEAIIDLNQNLRY